MIDLTQHIARVLSEYADKRIAVGVSGGRDSMCLLHAVTTCGAVPLGNILAVHVDHGLRETAKRDEQFVREYCKKNDIRFISFSVDVKRESAEKGLTIEQAARSLRYEVFYELIKSHEADCILTAHHALDNAESVLMHLFRGAGLDGMRGMENSQTTIGGEYLLRPFADVFPDDLEAYRAEHDIPFVFDETNAETDADRNFLRLRVMPLIEQRYAGAVKNIVEFARECKAASDALDGMLDMSLISLSGGAVVIADAALRSALATRYVRKAMQRFSLVDVTREQAENVARLVGLRTGAVAELANGVKAAREYGSVALYLPQQSCERETPVAMGANYLDGLVVDIEKSDASARTVRGGAVDLDSLSGAVLRFRRDGDMFTPYGGVPKKLKRFFIDSKIPKRVRDRTPLICKGSTVLVVVGVQVSEQAKQTAGTTARGVVSLRY